MAKVTRRIFTLTAAKEGGWMLWEGRRRVWFNPVKPKSCAIKFARRAAREEWRYTDMPVQLFIHSRSRATGKMRITVEASYGADSPRRKG